MQINTRFNLDETVYFRDDTQIKKVKIYKIEITIEIKNGSENICIKYGISHYGYLSERFLYKTKEDALKDMFKYINKLNEDVI